MKWMRKHNVDIDSADDDGVAPLYSAADDTRPKATKELYATGSNVNDFQPHRRPWIAAISRGHEESVSALLDGGADPKLAGENGQLPIYHAVEAGHLELVERFSRNPYVGEDFKGLSPAMVLLKAIKSSGEDTGFGQTPLSWAAATTQPKAVEFLVDAQSHVNSLNEYG
ncbi:ankyrin repeat-containing domain protein [Ustulina deusta]|nr:ankyrin repeat-containing domain protein [Ustulina deusta]